MLRKRIQGEGLCITPRVKRKLGILNDVKESTGIMNAWTKQS